MQLPLVVLRFFFSVSVPFFFAAFCAYPVRLAFCVFAHLRCTYDINMCLYALRVVTTDLRVFGRKNSAYPRHTLEGRYWMWLDRRNGLFERQHTSDTRIIADEFVSLKIMHYFRVLVDKAVVSRKRASSLTTRTPCSNDNRLRASG